MIQKNILWIILIFCIWFVTGKSLLAQDPHFSQFYASPLSLNPALSGAYNGTFRISTVYRDQWRSSLETPFRTFTASGDAKFNLDWGAKGQKDIVGVGITFLSDRVALFDFNTNQVHLSLAYHKALNDRNKQYLGIGFQGGILQRAINYEDLTFDDQFNAIDGYTLPTGEILPVNNRSFSDFSIGVYYTITPSKNLNYHIGLGYFHVNKPNISFFNSPDVIDPEIIKLNMLDAKWSVHTGLSIRTTDRLEIQPRLNGLFQGPYGQINVGTTLRYKLSKQEAKYLHIGPYIRGVKHVDESGIESLIAQVGLEANNFIFGFSYDQNLSSVIKNRANLSTFEFSIIYIGEYHNDDTFCPQF